MRHVDVSYGGVGYGLAGKGWLGGVSYGGSVWGKSRCGMAGESRKVRPGTVRSGVTWRCLASLGKFWLGRLG